MLIIDEAHKLNPTSLEALRVLLNYETNDVKLLQVVLLGQIELLPILQSLPNLNQRISMKYILRPLSVSEMSEMIHFRLCEAGYRLSKPMFSDEAIELIHKYTEGYPRRISLICHRALRSILMKESNFVDRGVIEELMQQEAEVGWTQTKILQKSSFSG